MSEPANNNLISRKKPRNGRMELALLQQHIRELATLPETHAPVISLHYSTGRAAIPS